MRPDNDDLIEFTVEAHVAETSAAWLLEVEGEKIWFPRSQCDYSQGSEVIYVPRWLAEKKGLV